MAEEKEKTVRSLNVLPHSGKVDALKSAPRVESAPSDYVPHVNRTRPKHALTAEQQALEEKVLEAIRSVYDPEIPVNIYELGLIYDIEYTADQQVKVRMTLTAPGCPVAGSMPAEVARKIENIPEVTAADVELVWEPAWNKEMMSEVARLELGM